MTDLQVWDFIKIEQNKAIGQITNVVCYSHKIKLMAQTCSGIFKVNSHPDGINDFIEKIKDNKLESLLPLKIKVKNESDSHALQRKLFSLGCKWISGENKNLINLFIDYDECYICININKRMTYEHIPYMTSQRFYEISLDLFYNFITKEVNNEEIKDGDRVRIIKKDKMFAEPAMDYTLEQIGVVKQVYVDRGKKHVRVLFPNNVCWTFYLSSLEKVEDEEMKVDTFLNKTVSIKNKKEWMDVQKKLLSIGFEWSGSGNKILPSYNLCNINISREKILTIGSDGLGNTWPYPVISYKDFCTSYNYYVQNTLRSDVLSIFSESKNDGWQHLCGIPFNYEGENTKNFNEEEEKMGKKTTHLFSVCAVNKKTKKILIANELMLSDSSAVLKDDITERLIREDAKKENKLNDIIISMNSITYWNEKTDEDDEYDD